MDVPLRHKTKSYEKVCYLVLILVVMDVPLRQYIHRVKKKALHTVLILVVMDVPLRLSSVKRQSLKIEKS